MRTHRYYLFYKHLTTQPSIMKFCTHIGWDIKSDIDGTFYLTGITRVGTADKN